MSVEQLNEKLDSLKKDLFFLRMQHATNQLDNPVKIAEVKRDIARVKTVLAELSASSVVPLLHPLSVSAAAKARASRRESFFFIKILL